MASISDGASSFGSLVLVGWHRIHGWVKSRWYGSSGYEPVQTHYYDYDLPRTSPSAAEPRPSLDWDS